jgi:HK97 gp10 family phage protein
MAVSAKVKGVPELIRKFNDLGERSTLEKIQYRATFGASKDLREAAKANAQASTQEHSGALLRAFALKRITLGTKRGYTVGMRAGRNRNKRSGDDAFYWWFLEFGTVHIAPLGFFTRAVSEARTKGVATIIAAGRKAVLDSGNRALRKFGNGTK